MSRNAKGFAGRRREPAGGRGRAGRWYSRGRGRAARGEVAGLAERRRVARLEDIPERGGLRVWLGERPVALFRWEGRVYALDDTCSHDEASLAEGEVLPNGRVVCPRHGAQFDLRSGRALTLPAVLPVRAYEVEVDGGDVYVVVP